MSTPLRATLLPAALRGRIGQEALTREAVCRALTDVSWPARATDLVHATTSGHAHPDIVHALQNPPHGVYLGPNQVCRTLFGPHGHTQTNP